jgi:hypothetical protein
MLLNSETREIRSTKIFVCFVKAHRRLQTKHVVLLNFSACSSKALHFMWSAIRLSRIESIQLLLFTTGTCGSKADQLVLPITGTCKVETKNLMLQTICAGRSGA